MGWFSSGPSFEGYTPPAASDENIQALRDKSLENMIFLEGGSFKYGNVEVPVILDGVPSNELIVGPIEDPDRAPISVGGFYGAAFAITNHDFDLYAAANDLPLRPDVAFGKFRQGPYPAAIAYHQAEAYCAWLSDLTGQPFALPTPQQWEYAARSGGQDVAYATQDGAYDYLEELYRAKLDGAQSDLHLPDAYPPNPAGFYGMSSNLADWVLDTWADPDTGAILAPGTEGDPEQRHRRVWRGATFNQQAELNSVYMYGAAGPVDRTRRLQINPEAGPYFEPDLQTIYLSTEVGARCVINLDSPPAETGFGRDAGPLPDSFPAAITPLERR